VLGLDMVSIIYSGLTSQLADASRPREEKISKQRALKKSLSAAQNIFSTILKFASLQMSACGANSFQNSPFELKHWICGRFSSPRMITEKILIRAQSFLFELFSNLNFSVISNTYYIPGVDGLRFGPDSVYQVNGGEKWNT